MPRGFQEVKVLRLRDNLHSSTGREEKKGKTQERMERGSKKEIFKCWE